MTAIRKLVMVAVLSLPLSAVQAAPGGGAKDGLAEEVSAFAAEQISDVELSEMYGQGLEAEIAPQACNYAVILWDEPGGRGGKGGTGGGSMSNVSVHVHVD